MARYQIPPDPRKEAKQRRSSTNGDKEPIPWRWLGMGLVVTIAGIGLMLAIINTMLARPPLDAPPLPPTVIILTAPPSPTPGPTPVVPTPTPIPTFTPVPTPNTAVAPPKITPGYYAEVINTDFLGVTVRGGPSVSNLSLAVAPEGALLLVLAGPEKGNDFLWWQVQLADGREGWVAGDFLQPAAAPR